MELHQMGHARQPESRQPGSRFRITRSILLAVVVAASAACSPAPTPSAAPSGSGVVPPASPTPVPTSTDASPIPAPSVGQTETAWGRIWDAVPGTFPRYPGSVPTTALSVLASAGYDVAIEARAVVAYYRDALEASGYATLAVDGPLEDGSSVIESAGANPDCRVRTSIAPSGGITLVLVLFAAACPFN